MVVDGGDVQGRAPVGRLEPQGLGTLMERQRETVKLGLGQGVRVSVRVGV